MRVRSHWSWWRSAPRRTSRAHGAAAAGARCNIVRQAAPPPPSKIPANTHYYRTIQAAVNASTAGDWVLIEPGTYYEEVKVAPAQSGIWIRGMNRNTVIIDGQHKVGNGIEINKANNVWVENLTVRNFDFGPSNAPMKNAATRPGGTADRTRTRSKPTAGGAAI